MAYGDPDPTVAAPDPSAAPLSPTNMPLGAIGGLPPSLLNAPPVMPRTAPDMADLTPTARNVPAVAPEGSGIARAPSRWDLTKHIAVPNAPGLNPTPPGWASANQTFGQAATDPTSGQFSPMNPGLTKLGKVLTILGSLGRGAAEGMSQPDFGRGFAAANQARQQDVQNYQGEQTNALNQALLRGKVAQLPLEQQKLAADVATAQQASQFVPTAYGPLPMAVAKLLLPAQIKAESAQDVAGTQAASRELVARIGAASHEKIAGVQGTLITPEIQQRFGLPPEFLGTKMKVSDVAALNRGSMFRHVPLATGLGMMDFDRQTQQVKPLTINGQQVPITQWGQITQVPDPDSPGNTKFATLGEARSQGMQGMGSAAFRVPLAQWLQEVVPHAGVTRMAFNTALDHANLLEQAIRALNNGDVQTLNRLGNRFKNEFGLPGPVTADAISEAYTREIAKMLTSGNLTVNDTKDVSKTLDPEGQSQEESLGVINAYRALATAKMQQLDKQGAFAAEKARTGGKGGGGNAPAGGGGNTPANTPPPPKHPAGFHRLGGQG